MDSLESHLNSICLESQTTPLDKWRGFPQKELYSLALSFYKGFFAILPTHLSSYQFLSIFPPEKNGKAFHLTYDDNTKLVAFSLQAKTGAFDPSSAPPLGVLDMIGKDRRVAWQNLGSMPKEEAIDGFIELVEKLCPSFSPYIEAVKKNKEEMLRLELEQKRKEEESLVSFFRFL